MKKTKKEEKKKDPMQCFLSLWKPNNIYYVDIPDGVQINHSVF